MRKIYAICLAFLLFHQGTFGQVLESEKKLRTISADTVEGWKKGAIISLNFVQSSFSNWAAGGNSSIALNSLFSFYAKYKKKNHYWENYLDFGYGLVKEGKADLQKTDDRLEFMSKYGQKAFGHWYYSGLLNLRTQATPGYNYPSDAVKISDFLAPAYIMAALGMDYKPNDYLSLFVAPLTSKITVVNNTFLSDKGAFGVEPGKKIRSEVGGYLRFVFAKKDFKGELLKNVSLNTKVDLFSNYLLKPSNIDVNWETLITMKVNKFLNVSLNTQLLYDDDVDIINNQGVVLGPRTQFREIFGVGATFKF